jgi:hypothetical protein
MENEEHLKWVDQIKAAFQPVEEQGKYLQDAANRRKQELDEERMKAKVRAGRR